MNYYRYQLERYRGVSTRYTCPQCRRKHTFTRYIDTENNNQYLSDNVGKCNRLDKCGYHYTPKQYFTDNPHKRDRGVSSFSFHREKEEKKIENPQPPKLTGRLPRWFMERTLGVECDYKLWLRDTFGEGVASRIIADYRIGGAHGDPPNESATYAIFWQVDYNGDVRTGKLMNYDPATGKRIKGEGAYVNWMHSIMRSEGVLPEGWELEQCLYGEHLLSLNPKAVVALAEGPKTAHIGSALMPDMVWVAVDSMTGLSAERLRPLKGRSVVLFPDEGRGYTEWQRKIVAIAEEVGFSYCLSEFVEHNLTPGTGGDIGELVIRGD